MKFKSELENASDLRLDDILALSFVPFHPPLMFEKESILKEGKEIDIESGLVENSIARAYGSDIENKIFW
ncbi:599_t:CDS:2 [Cetraspora pellucida]|uniref:599_t:CDS:1 n=1 Tax=Cetraspora pellucida TaxID=1433469 RepID=A0A9N9ELK8_9GLOM|nr:599_t:CDS:2 [Cetraspora pellucida]